MDKDIQNLVKERNTFEYAFELLQILFSVLCKEDALKKAEILNKTYVH